MYAIKAQNKNNKTFNSLVEISNAASFNNNPIKIPLNKMELFYLL